MFSAIKIHGNMDSNYIWTSKGTMSDEEIEDFVASQTANPTWTTETILLSPFQGSLRADNPSILNDVIKYRIQRKNVSTGDIVDIGIFDGETTAIKDFSIGNSVEAQYYVIPVFEVDGVEFYGDPILANPIKTSYDGWSVVELLPGEAKNEYVVNEDNIWHFDLNTEVDSYVLNSDKQFLDGFGRFSKSISGNRMYLSGGFSALVGHVSCNGEYISDDVAILKKFYRFCHNATPKLLKDTKGNVLIVDIEPQSQIDINHKTSQQPTTISFKFREIENIENIVVRGVVC